jgi:choline dehydrogenase
MGISYRVNAITASSLADPQFLHESERQFRQEQRGILTSPGGDFLGKSELQT